MNTKGHYSVLLIDSTKVGDVSIYDIIESKDHESIVTHIEQDNFISDYAYRASRMPNLNNNTTNNINRIFTNRIKLLNGTLNSGDPRKLGGNMGLTQLAYSSEYAGAFREQGGSYDLARTYHSTEYIFPEPSSDRTISHIGVSSFSNDNYQLSSVIELSSPIIQTPNQKIFVRYEVDMAYVSNKDSLNAVGNSYVDYMGTYHANYDSNNRWSASDGGTQPITNVASAYATQFGYSFLLPPSNYSLAGRHPPSLVSHKPNVHAHPDATYSSSKFKVDYNTTSVGQSAHVTQVTVFGNCVVGISDTRPSTPTVKGPWLHSSDDTSPWLDPSKPPLSRGNLALSGTASTSYFSMWNKLKCTRTGDASTIENDIVSFNDSTIITTLDWDNSVNASSIVKVRFTTTGTLPNEILVDTDYYLIYISNSAVKLATSIANAESNTFVILTGSPTGVHTMERLTTAKFSLQNYPISSHEYLYRRTHIPLYKRDGSIAKGQGQPSADMHAVKNATIDTFLFGDDYYMLYNAEDQRGGYVYSSNTYTNYGKSSLYKWNYLTLEASQHIIDTDDAWGGIKVNDEIWIMTLSSIIIYNTTSQTQTHTLDISILHHAGATLLYTDLLLDEATGNVWICHHNTGFTVLNSTDKTLVALHTSATTLASGSGITGYHREMTQGYFDVHDNVMVWSIPGEANDNYCRVRYLDVTEGIYARLVASHKYAKALLRKDGSKDIIITGARETIYYYKYIGHSAGAPEYETMVSYTSTDASVNNDNATPHGLTVPTLIDDTVYFAKGPTRGDYYNDLFGFNLTNKIWSYSTTSNSYRFASDNIHYTRTNIVRGEYPVNGYRGIFNNVSNAFFPCRPFTKMIHNSDVFISCGFEETNVGSTFINIDENKRVTPTPTNVFDFSATSDVITNFYNGLGIQLQNAGGIASDQQFIEGEYFTIATSPGHIRSNLDSASIRYVHYLTDARQYNVSITSNGLYTVPEEVSIDFRSLDEVKITQSDVAVDGGLYTLNESAGTIDFDASLDGQTIDLEYIVVYRR